MPTTTEVPNRKKFAAECLLHKFLFFTSQGRLKKLQYDLLLGKKCEREISIAKIFSIVIDVVSTNLCQTQT